MLNYTSKFCFDSKFIVTYLLGKPFAQLFKHKKLYNL